jgi:hypothetical protein
MSLILGTADKNTSRCFSVLLAPKEETASSCSSSSASTNCERLSHRDHLLLWVLWHVCEQRSGGKRGCEPWQGSGGQGRVVRIQRPKPRDNVILSDLPWTPWCWEQPDVLLILMARQGKTASMRAHPPHLVCPSTVDAFTALLSGQWILAALTDWSLVLRVSVVS